MATALLPDGKTMRVAVSGHPKEYEKKPLHDVWAAVVDLQSGAVTLPSSGKVIANLRDGSGLPLDYRDLELVEKTPADRTVNVMDVSDGPVFEIAFTSKIKDDHSNRDAQYNVTALRDGAWRRETVAPAGDRFGYIHAGFYVGGMAFPDRSPGGQVYVTREEGGLWSLERWDRDAAGRWQPRVLIPPGPTRLTRPWAVTNPAPGSRGHLPRARALCRRQLFRHALPSRCGRGRLMAAPVGVGIVGCGWAAGSLCEAVDAIDDAVIAAAFDEVPSAAARLAEPRGATVHATMDALLADPNVQVVYVGLPHHLLAQGRRGGAQGRQACARRKADGPRDGAMPRAWPPCRGERPDARRLLRAAQGGDRVARPADRFRWRDRRGSRHPRQHDHRQEDDVLAVAGHGQAPLAEHDSRSGRRGRADEHGPPDRLAPLHHRARGDARAGRDRNASGAGGRRGRGHRRGNASSLQWRHHEHRRRRAQPGGR